MLEATFQKLKNSMHFISERSLDETLIRVERLITENKTVPPFNNVDEIIDFRVMIWKEQHQRSFRYCLCDILTNISIIDGTDSSEYDSSNYHGSAETETTETDDDEGEEMEEFTPSQSIEDAFASNSPVEVIQEDIAYLLAENSNFFDDEETDDDQPLI